MKATELEIKKAAKELNSEWGLDPAINVKDPDECLNGLKEAIKLIKEDDEFTPATQKVIDEILKEKPAPAEKAKAGKKAKVETEPEPESEPEDVELTWDILKELEEEELIALVEEKELEVDPDDFEDDEVGLRKAIAKELEIEVPKKKAKVEEAPAPAAKKGKVEEKKAPAKAAAKPAKEPKEEKKTFVAAAYNRVDALCEALQAGVTDIDDWSKKADKLLVKNGGSSNDKENKFTIGYFYKINKNIDLGVKLPKKG